MNSLPRLTLALAAAGFFVSQEPNDEPDPGREPLGRYSLTVDGTSISLIPGRPATLRLGDSDHTLMLVAPTTRLFDFGGIAFEYPAGMNFEYDGETPGCDMWSFDGNDAVLMVQAFSMLDRDGVQEVLVESLREQFESMGATIKESTCRLDLSTGAKDGLRFEIALGDVGLVQELYSFQGPRGGVALILQDSRDIGAPPTEEFRTLATEIAATLRISP